MNGDTLELMKMKKQIESAKTELAQAEGEMKSVLRHMEDKFGCKNKKEGIKNENSIFIET